MRIHRSTKPFEIFYTLNNNVLAQVDKAKYIGVMITETLAWNFDITQYSNKANICLGFIKRNISNWSQELRQLAYLSLVRSQLEYACVVWEPYQIKDISNVEKCKERQQDLSNKTTQNISVIRMMHDLAGKIYKIEEKT